MEGMKCGQCRLVNPSTEITCRRCGHLIGIASSDRVRGPREAARGASWLYTILALALIGSAVAYVFFGLEKSYNKIEMDETKRTDKQPKTQPTEQTRSQFEKQQTGHYGTAIQNSNGLAQSQKHVDEVEKLMAPSKDRPSR
jgi:hypothetical protein